MLQVFLLTLVCCALWGTVCRATQFVLGLVPRSVLLVARFAIIFGVLMYVDIFVDDSNSLKRVYEGVLNETFGLLFGSL